MDIHVALCFNICIVIQINKIVCFEASIIYSNNQNLPWRDAMTLCIDAGGTPVDKDIYRSTNVQLENQTYWTSDFTTKTVLTSDEAHNVTDALCGYKVFYRPRRLSEEKFENCSFQYNYICCAGGSVSYFIRPECIRSGTWEEAYSCNQTHFVSSFLPNGNYWTGTIIGLTVHRTQEEPKWYYQQEQNIFQCGTINRGGTFSYRKNCNKTRPSYCSFVDHGNAIPNMRVCSSPISTLENTLTASQRAKRLSKDSRMVMGVSVGVGITVVFAIVLIGVIFLHRRGMICQPRIKETEAHANAAYGVTHGDVLFSLPALSTNDNANQHRDNESGRTKNVYSGDNKQNPKIKGMGPKAPYGKEKKRVRTACDTKRPAKETTTQEYDNTCFKDSRKLVQRNDYDHHEKGTDAYNTTRLGNIQLPHDSEYNTLGERGVYNVADLRGNKAPNAIANDGTYNTLSNQKEDYNTVNLHRDNAPHAALRSDDTYNTFRNNTDDYNVVVLNGETNPNLMIHHDDTYNTLGRGTEEYNTVDYYRTSEVNKSEDCYDHYH